MRRQRVPLTVFLFLISACAAVAQGDGCLGALGALNRVKEQIVPTLTPDTEAGKRHLKIIQSTLENGTHLCKDVPELWFYRMVVSQRLSDTADVKYSKQKIEDLDYDRKFEHHFDPFTLPPSAVSSGDMRQIAAAKVHKKWALVVGIDNFSTYNELQLHYAVKDSNDFVKFLVDPKGGGFDPARVQHLTDKSATLAGIRHALGQLRVDAKPDDLVVIYFAGHGSPRSIDPNGVSYILTNDTVLKDPVTLYESSLQMIDLVQIVNRDIKARNVVIFLDTCSSGDAVMAASEDGASSFSGAFENLMLGYGRAVVTASRADESSFESPNLQNGYFTHYLVEALRAGSRNKKLDEVYPEVLTKVSSRVRTEQGKSQNPSFEFSEHGGEIVLGVPEAVD